MRKSKQIKIFDIMIYFFSFIAMIGLVMPMEQGIEGVLQIIIKCLSILILMVMATIILVKRIFKQGKVEKKYKTCFIIFGVIVIFCAHEVVVSTMGLAEGIQTVHCDDYKVDYHNVYVAHDNYLLDFEADGQKGSVYITRDMYNRLKHSDKEIIVTYYPYIDVVDEIIFVE